MRGCGTQTTTSADLKAVRIQLSACTVSESAVLGISAISGRTLGVRLEQPTLDDHHFRQTEVRIQLRRVLANPPIARLLATEEVPDDAKRMGNLCSNTDCVLLELLAQQTGFRLGQRAALTGVQRNDPRHSTALILLALLNTLMVRISEGCGFITMQQSAGLSGVAHIGGGGDQLMVQPRISINTNARFHTGIPLVALLSFMHLRVALNNSVFRLGRRSDDRHAHDGASFSKNL